MLIKVSELQGNALDYAVAQIELGINLIDTWHPAYSTNWAYGGPIIEREEVCIWKSPEPEKGKWASAGPQWMDLDVESAEFIALPDPWHGPTPLIAAMRCYVASKVGDTIEIPDELLD
jgi:hypothetical protein